MRSERIRARGRSASRARLGALAVAAVMLMTVLPWASTLSGSAARRHLSGRRPPRPLVRGLPSAAGMDQRRLPPRAMAWSRRFVQSVQVAVPHGRSRRRLRIHVPRTRPASSAVRHTVAALPAAGERARPAAPPPRAAPPGPRGRRVSSGPGIRSIIAAAATRHHVAPGWLLRVAVCESGLDPLAYNAGSGASGLFQFMPGTFYGNGGRNLWDPVEQAEVAATMFAAGESSAWACA
ncbi:MAG TPA: transglycosylase SLT domain-containing protein [Candidatus Micrarchaeia archaeon]|nr:transglycosylase SLT domain-containing protein [Candidatus Micrarchaeia archaeon]